jgi:large subunit ribosomal protein L22
MQTMARARFVRVSARKARLVLDQIRGKSVGEALATLEYTPRAAARLVEKVLRSAVANAEHNYQVRNLDDLRVVQAIADGGPSMKRVQPRADQFHHIEAMPYLGTGKLDLRRVKELGAELAAK